MITTHKYINRLSEIPTKEHLAILIQETISIPGDERSRTNPGHGYPASQEIVFKYIYFEDILSLEDYIKSGVIRDRAYFVMKVIPGKIETKYDISFKFTS